jgi:ElaB/YqjD/DUF883 family membrane-anchored ribosome-binding protein
MFRQKIVSALLGLFSLSLMGYTVRLHAQVEPNFEEKFIEISLPDTNYILNYVNVKNTEGLKFLTARIKNNGANFPLMLIKEKEALPLKKLLELYESMKPEQKNVDTYTAEFIKISDEKDKARAGLDSLQNARIAYLKETNADLMDINKTLTVQYKAAISTAKEANKGWSWQGIKDIVMGTAAGLAIGLLIGLTR